MTTARSQSRGIAVTTWSGRGVGVGAVPGGGGVCAWSAAWSRSMRAVRVEAPAERVIDIGGWSVVVGGVGEWLSCE